MGLVSSSEIRWAGVNTDRRAQETKIDEDNICATMIKLPNQCLSMFIESLSL